MIHKMARLLAITLISISLLTTYSPSEALANIEYKYSHGHMLKWNRVMLSICLTPESYELPGIWEATTFASDLWNTVPNVPHTFVKDQNDTYCDIYINYKYLPPNINQNFLAANTVKSWDMNGEIYKSYIDFNRKYAGKFGYAKLSKNLYDVKSIMVHEMGHAFGLGGDEENSNNVMYEYTSMGEASRRTLSSEDVSALQYLYRKE